MRFVGTVIKGTVCCFWTGEAVCVADTALQGVPQWKQSQAVAASANVGGINHPQVELFKVKTPLRVPQL